MTATLPVLAQSTLPLPVLRRGNVREVYEVDAESLLLVASDRVSAFDVVMKEPVPMKGAVLTQVSAFWFRKLEGIVDHHMLSADADEIIARIPALAGHRSQVAGRRSQEAHCPATCGLRHVRCSRGNSNYSSTQSPLEFCFHRGNLSSGRR